MKYKIVVDSSSDLRDDYLKSNEIGFKVVPLTINVGSKVFVDNEKLDVNEMLAAMDAYEGKSTSSCPSPGEFLTQFSGHDYVFCVTISSKLSGCYNSANAAKDQLGTNNVHIIDSKATSGTLVLIVDKLVELINKGLSYEKIKEEIDRYVNDVHLLFVLNKFDNLVKNGRMSKVTAIFAMALFIKPLCEAVEGEIKIAEKPRTLKAAYKRLVIMVKDRIQDFTNRTCIITHCQEEEAANEVAKMIKEEYNFKEVRVNPMRGLCSFYALRKGIIVCF